MQTKALEERGQEHISVAGYVLREGRPFGSSPLTQEEKEYIDICNWREHRKRDCYYNAQMTAMSMPPRAGIRLLYAEGFVNTGNGVPIHHAWLSLNGKVVDTTLRTGGEGRPGTGHGRTSPRNGSTTGSNWTRRSASTPWSTGQPSP